MDIPDAEGNEDRDPSNQLRKPHEIKETGLAGPYASRFTKLLIEDSASKDGGAEILKSLSHVNCSYLSKIGQPPTLTQLKQHAQALAILIKQLSTNTKLGEINNASDDSQNVPRFGEGETFDWLSDLTKPYQNDEAYHNKPLNAIQNEYNDNGSLIPDICPLHKRKLIANDNHLMLYADVEALISHADDILTRLDHEYSAKGGLLAILPKREDAKNRAKAEKTLLGSLILFTQNLVGRMHQLEIQYANALDTLAGEAVVPRQTISELGSAGRAGRPVCYPQDRFVLTNAGNDVWDYLNRELDRKDMEARIAELHWDSQGVVGEVVRDEGTTSNMKGISYVDVVTRYLRVRSRESKTIFMIPAHASHLGVKVTHEMESKPSVVAVQRPYWPERASVWEDRQMQYLRDHMENEANLKADLKKFAAWKKDNTTLSAKYLESQSKIIVDLHNEIHRLTQILNQPGNEPKLDLATRLIELKEKEDAADREREELEERGKALGVAWAEQERKLKLERERFEEQKRKMMAIIRSRARTSDMTLRRRIVAVEAREMELGMH
ncbi:hypothetical protein F5884DRAFT_393977 [Xylogone sp. PMI_703]|nr:hypothetical protein F5884DRAFT_393977 [Xylogone sp. PMI_703]